MISSFEVGHVKLITIRDYICEVIISPFLNFHGGLIEPKI